MRRRFAFVEEFVEECFLALLVPAALLLTTAFVPSPVEPVPGGSPPTDDGGEWIAFTGDPAGPFDMASGQSDIYVVAADGSGVTRLTDAPSNDFTPAWSPDGTRLAFRSQRNGQDGSDDIYVMNVDGARIRPI